MGHVEAGRGEVQFSGLDGGCAAEVRGLGLNGLNTDGKVLFILVDLSALQTCSVSSSSMKPIMYVAFSFVPRQAIA